MPLYVYFATVKKSLQQAAIALKSIWFKYEPYLFALILLVNVIPVLGVRYFFTGDGPAHLYNSNIIIQLLTNPQGEAHKFFELRHGLVPNDGGHIILSILNAWLPANVAEKIVYILCLLLLPLGFRYLIKKVTPGSAALCYLIFPLAHNFCFYIGFQSFCLGLGLMFFTLGYFLFAHVKGDALSYFILACLLFLTVLFHLFTAVVALMALTIYLAMELLRHGVKSQGSLLAIFLSAIPTLVFCGFFLFSNTGEGFHFNQTAFSQLIKGIVAGIPIITIDTAEIKYSQPFNILLCAGIGLCLIHRIKRGIRPGVKDFSVITALLLFALYFVMPDELASGGFISLRLLLCAYLFLAFWISSFLNRSVVSILFMAAIIFLNIKMVDYHLSKARELSADAIKIAKAADFIPAGSTVLPLNYSYHWLQYNIGLYLGSEKNLIILDNYEASTTHFPVKWKEESYPAGRLGDFASSHRPLLKLAPYEDFSGNRLDAVVRWKHSFEMTDSITLKTDSILNEDFRSVYTSADGDVEVYLRKP